LVTANKVLMLPSLFYQYRPAPPLDRFIERIWYWQGESTWHGKDRIMPDGGGSLIINMAEDEVRNYGGANDDQIERYPGAVFVGAHSRYSVIDAEEQKAVIGISFRPGGTWPFFDPAADELQNSHVNIADLWGSAGRTLRERVLDASTPRARLARLEQELLLQAIRPLQRRPEVEFALEQLTAPQDAISIQRLGERCGLSTRRLQRLFAIEVGLTPKLYARIRRFQRMFGRLSERQFEWSELAQACGYFDQSHLIRDCKLISGFTPTELQVRWNGTGHHVPTESLRVNAGSKP
jgi:AraC-like DNA-binding protein